MRRKSTPGSGIWRKALPQFTKSMTQILRATYPVTQRPSTQPPPIYEERAQDGEGPGLSPLPRRDEMCAPYGISEGDQPDDGGCRPGTERPATGGGHPGATGSHPDTEETATSGKPGLCGDAEEVGDGSGLDDSQHSGCARSMPERRRLWSASRNSMAQSKR